MIHLPSKSAANWLTQIHVKFASAPTDYLRAWKEYYFPPDVSISDSVRVLAFQFLESIHAWIQFIFNGGLWEKFLEWTWLSQREGSFGRDLSSGSSNHGRKEDLPELEYVPPLKGSVVALDFQPKAGEKRPRVRMNTTPLSPAFLDETTYPRGWMVYHRELGVVAKCDADEYDVKRAADDKEEKPVGFDEEKKDESEHGDPLDDDKTLHRSNTSPRQQVSAQQKDAEDDSSSSEENPTSAASFPVLHSIVAGG